MEVAVPGNRLNVLRALSLLDGVLLVVLLVASLTKKEEAVAVVGPTHGLLYLLLIGSLLLGVGRRWWGWGLVLGVAALGPLVSIPALERVRAKGRSRPS